MISLFRPILITDILAPALKVFEIFKLTFTIRTKAENRTIYKYIKRIIKHNQTIFIIGEQQEEHIFLLRKLVGITGKVIIFTFHNYFFQHIYLLLQRMNWQNVIVESLDSFNSSKEITVDYLYKKENNKTKEPIQTVRHSIPQKNYCYQSLDNYSFSKNALPHFVIINMASKESEF